MGDAIKRILRIDLPKARSAFLWGPRKVGKSYWIRNQFLKNEYWFIDLLKTDEQMLYRSRPSLLRERWKEEYKITIIDEIQKIPALLDEVHWLIENKQASFLLTGSSARKLKHGHANMLGGRAWRFEMGPLSYMELKELDLHRAMETGLIPIHYLSPDPQSDLRSYVSDYLKEEIVEEGLVQNLPAFSEFIKVAAVMNGELINYNNISREVGVSAKVVKGYYQILEDTLLGFRLRPWRKKVERRLITADKFYLFDLGVVNYLARRRPVAGNSDFGHAFEHFILQEILNYRRYKNPELEVTYWRTASDIEVDFILGEMEIAVEVKATEHVHKGHLSSIRSLKAEYHPRHSIVVSLEKMARVMEDGIEILPWQEFIERLWADGFQH